MKYEVRQYQEEILDAVKKSNVDENLIIYLATSGGKSYIIKQIVSQIYPKSKILVLIRRSDLIPQLIEVLSSTVDFGVLKAGYEYKSNTKVLLAMEQTFVSRYKKLTLEYDIIIKDEFHEGLGKTWELIYNHIEPKKVIGLSGTPINEKAVGLIHVPIAGSPYYFINGASLKRLIKEGYASPFKYVFPDYDIELDSLKDSNKYQNDYSTESIDIILNTPDFLNALIKEYKTYCQNRKTMVFANSVKACELIFKTFSDAGIERVGVVHYKRLDEENRATITAYKNGELKVIINQTKLTTGFDDPTTDALILARPTKVLRLHLQILGRGARIAPNKQYCLVIDLVKNIQELGFPDEDYDFTAKEVFASEESAITKLMNRNEIIDKEKVLEYKNKNLRDKINELATIKTRLLRKIDNLEEEKILLKHEKDKYKERVFSLQSTIEYMKKKFKEFTTKKDDAKNYNREEAMSLLNRLIPFDYDNIIWNDGTKNEIFNYIITKDRYEEVKEELKRKIKRGNNLNSMYYWVKELKQVKELNNKL